MLQGPSWREEVERLTGLSPWLVTQDDNPILLCQQCMQCALSLSPALTRMTCRAVTTGDNRISTRVWPDPDPTQEKNPLTIQKRISKTKHRYDNGKFSTTAHSMMPQKLNSPPATRPVWSFPQRCDPPAHLLLKLTSFPPSFPSPLMLQSVNLCFCINLNFHYKWNKSTCMTSIKRIDISSYPNPTPVLLRMSKTTYTSIINIWRSESAICQSQLPPCCLGNLGKRVSLVMY